MIVHTQKVMPILLSLLMLIGFSWPCVSGSISGPSLGACGILGMYPRLIPPHSVGKPYTNSPPSSIVTIANHLGKITSYTVWSNLLEVYNDNGGLAMECCLWWMRWTGTNLARVWFPAQNVTEDLSFILGAGSGQTPGGQTINNLGIVESSVWAMRE